jgi:hypothetical protein
MYSPESPGLKPGLCFTQSRISGCELPVVPVNFAAYLWLQFTCIAILINPSE